MIAIISHWKLILMTCYFRHMKDIFLDIGVEVTPENKRDIDRIIHGIVGVEYKNCSPTWKAIKEKLAEDRDGFIATLKDATVSFQ